MEITTKYNSGDIVWQIMQAPTQTWVPCGFCEEIGRVTGANGETHLCPECVGRKGEKQFGKASWQAAERLTIGQVEVRIVFASKGMDSDPFDNYKPQKYQRKETYMCLETGIGTGSCHSVDDLFVSLEHAQDECDKRNAEEADGDS